LIPDDLSLDQTHIRSANPLKLYRITRAKYASLSGAGAAFAPGRWNWQGQEAIYTSLDPSTPQLEYLAHTRKDLIPSNLVMMEIHLRRTRDWVEGTDRPEGDLSHFLMAGMLLIPTLGMAKRMFPGILNTSYASLCAVAVPSVITPAWNVVLYPAGAGFWDHVSLHSITPFDFDPRLFPENTPKESV